MKKILIKIGLSLLAIILIISFIYFYSPREGTEKELSKIDITNSFKLSPMDYATGSIYNGNDNAVVEVTIMVGTHPSGSTNLFDTFDEKNQKEYKYPILIKPKSSSAYVLKVFNANSDSDDVVVSIKSVKFKRY
jgi:hypothetical protein